MHRFYWVSEGFLAGSSHPGASGDLGADLGFLRDRGISAILTLTETELDPWAIDRAQMASLHLPIFDMTAPQPSQFLEALAFIDDQQASARATVVHCLAGQGRTGSILAAWLIRQGATAQEALAAIRLRCPGAVENDDQEAALERFANSQMWLV